MLASAYRYALMPALTLALTTTIPAKAENPFVGNTVNAVYSDTETRCSTTACEQTFNHPLANHTLYVSSNGQVFDYSGVLQRGAGKGSVYRFGEPQGASDGSGYQFLWSKGEKSITVRAINTVTHYERQATYSAVGSNCRISISSRQPGYKFTNAINLSGCKILRGNVDSNIKN